MEALADLAALIPPEWLRAVTQLWADLRGLVAGLSPPASGAFDEETATKALIIAAAAVLIDGLVGEPRFLTPILPHPRRWVGRLASHAERRLNRPERSERVRLFRGVLLLLAMLLLGVAAGLVAMTVSSELPKGWLLELALLLVCLSQRQPLARLARLRRTLQRDGLEPARLQLELWSRRDTRQLDSHGVARAGIETAARRLTEGAVAPLFWYLVAGPVGLTLYAVCDAANERLGFLAPRFEAFGLALRRADALMKLVPARMAGLLVVIAALALPGARPLAGLGTMARHARHHRSQAAGWPIGALAGALDLALAGPRRYPQEIVEEAWIGDGRARAVPADMARAATLIAVAALLNAGLQLGLLALVAVVAAA